ncbi:MAG: hypothetical protein HY660_08075 [Armatimonadetes bacterium]|nr:hypothetical protein [Armatimonadota bacterium]
MRNDQRDRPPDRREIVRRMQEGYASLGLEHLKEVEQMLAAQAEVLGSDDPQTR